jgi:hypothetical protein
MRTPGKAMKIIVEGIEIGKKYEKENKQVHRK